MDWSDENFVKLYTRDTATWKAWPWQGRAVFPLLMRKLTGAGLLAAGRLALTRAVAVMIEIPEEVVAPAVDAFIADGTVEKVASGLLVPKFLEAQEARKTDKRKSADYRAKVRDIAKAAQQLEAPVTHGYKVSPSSPAQPCPAPIKKKGPVAEKPATPRDPRLEPLKLALVADYLHLRGDPYKHGGAKDTVALKGLLPLADDEEIRLRWEKALRLGDAWPGCSTFAQLASKWNDLAAPSGQKRFFDPNEGVVGAGMHQCSDPSCPECGPVLAAASAEVRP